MDYNDQLWEKKLQEQARKELGNEMSNPGPNFHLSLEDNRFKVDDEGYLSRESIIDGIDNLKGTPDEQIKNLVSAKVSRLVNLVEDSLGWPDVVKTYEHFTVKVIIEGNNGPSDPDDIDLVIPVDDYNDQPPGIPIPTNWY